ncbi:putative O-linked N-acetylglucosamine transferase (SPINDLY family) [Neorhizobium huautlense]|uniref:O-linked N-acetylglucosamine transferase (SPINDLY family) n=1 Tax=Neorhizobium huautlense TaxID=67774 RepID=A0ABT9PTG4_9HYPH|nr:glycosyl transferase [Neorhizobium huautlense]MDP9837765.1 putative O-linked N-acetylglucosamine transferase (SPINDLY family) [Neorhizobium huautlense]
MTSQPQFADASKSFHSGRYTDALTILNRLLDHSKDVKTYGLLARTFLALGFREDAARAYKLAAELGGTRADEYNTEALKLFYELGQDDEALSLGLPLLKQAQQDPDLAFIIASLFLKRGESEGLRAFLSVLSTSTNSRHNSLAFMLLTGSPENASDREAVANMLARMPKSIILIMAHLVNQREVNAYFEQERLQPQLERMVAKDPKHILRVEAPFYNLTWLADEALNKLAGYRADAYPADLPQKRRSAPHVWGDKIRIGYLSSDFWSPHATMKLFSAVLESHDPARFDVTLFCYTEPAYLEKDTRRGLWGRIVSVRDMTDAQAAEAIRAQNIDILIELKGHTRGGRAAILNHSAAPVQVAWLGFPGSTVNTDLDYVIGDHSVLPDKAKPHYWEKFCRLPESYQPNNPHQPLAQPDMFTRADAELPPDAFVFASFNATRKISIATINLWIRILKATPGSVLWLMVKTPEAEANITRKLQAGGIERKRFVFTKMVGHEAHLSRIVLADLGLDTFPYNGHTTTSEQLWAGLPVLTMKGTHFASRVSESLLNAIGLPETIAENEDDYFRRAVDLYNDRQTVAEYSERLHQNRFRMPLFDAERFCRHLESAYEMMAKRARTGQPPDHIDVPALPARTTDFRS